MTEAKPEKITGVYLLDTVQALFMAGQEMRILVEIKAEEGEKYPPSPAKAIGTIRAGEACLEIQIKGNSDLIRLWQRAERIRPRKR